MGWQTATYRTDLAHGAMTWTAFGSGRGEAVSVLWCSQLPGFWSGGAVPAPYHPVAWDIAAHRQGEAVIAFELQCQPTSDLSWVILAHLPKMPFVSQSKDLNCKNPTVNIEKQGHCQF